MTLTELHLPSTWPLALGIILLFAASWGVVSSPQSCDPFSSIVTQPVGIMDGRITSVVQHSIALRPTHFR